MWTLPNREDLSATELYHIALNANLNAHPLLPRSVLYAIIEGEPVELPERVINKKRLRIMTYVDENWAALEALVGDCPARSRELTACHHCPDIQVACCVRENATKFIDENE